MSEYQKTVAYWLCLAMVAFGAIVFAILFVWSVFIQPLIEDVTPAPSSLRSWLEVSYFLSQILLFVTAIFALVFARHQILVARRDHEREITRHSAEMTLAFLMNYPESLRRILAS